MSAETRKGRVPDAAAAPRSAPDLPAAGAPAAGLSAVGAIVRRRDRDRYQTALFAPADRREALFALYAFNFEIARIREAVTQPMLGQIRLQWWREVIEAAFSGGPARRHEVALPLVTTIRNFGLSRASFDRIIDTRERDLDDTPPADLAALIEYAEGTSSALLVLALEALGTLEPATGEAARDIGIAYALAGLLRAMPFHAASGRRYIPEHVAVTVGLDPADYARRRNTSELRTATEMLTEAAAAHLASGRRSVGRIPRRSLAALLPAVIADRYLLRLKRAGFNPFAPELAAPDPLQSWRLAAAALRRRF
ncbi:MAG: phytoene/squalene synthase family protein [Alphaproteobacteria bacterium]